MTFLNVAIWRNIVFLDGSYYIGWMKTLYVIRHAKSSWDDPTLSDFDRPLNNRGKKDAPTMGKRLAQRQVVPDLLLSSPAERALTTCKIIAEEIHYPAGKIKTDKIRRRSFQLRNYLIAYVLGTHLWLQIIRGNLWRRT